MSQLRPAVLGALGPAQLACLRSWTALGLRPAFVHVLEGRRPAFLDRLCGAYLGVTEAETEDPDFPQRLGGFLAEHGITGITTVSYDDALRLHRWRPALPEGVDLWVADPTVMDTLRSKHGQVELAGKVGLERLPTHYLAAGGLTPIPEQHYPLVLRPDDDSAVEPIFKAVRIEDPAELARFVATRQVIRRPLLAQPFVNGPNLVVHGARSAAGVLFQCAFLVARKYRGVTLTLEPRDLDPDLADKCEAFVDALGLVGVYHFEFLLDPGTGRPLFLEINGRLGGTTGKACVAGYDEPAAILAAHGARSLPPPIMRGGRVVTNKRAVLKALGGALAGRLTPLDYPMVALPRRVADLCGGLVRWHDEILGGGSPWGSLAYLSQALPGRRVVSSSATGTRAAKAQPPS